MTTNKTSYLPLIFLPIIIILCFGLWAVNKSPLTDVIVDSTTGVFDMRDIDFKTTYALTQRIVQYIPNELLMPEDFALRDDIQVGKIPEGTEVSTMRIRLLVPDGIHYGIAGYAPNYASSVYINDEWIYDQGKPAFTLEDEKSSEAYRLISAHPVDGVIEIVVQTSGFANVDTDSGIGFFVGEYELSRIYYTRVITQDIIVMSAYILLTLFSLLLFLVLPSYKATGWLSLLSLVWVIRVGLKSRKILLTLFPDHTWNFAFKTEIITSPLTILLLVFVLHSVFTGALPKWLRAVIISGSALMALAVVVLPWPTFLGHSSWSNPPIYWSLTVMLGFILFFMRHKKPTLSQLITLVGMGAVVFAFAWDERYFGNVGLPFAMTQPMMLTFIMFMLTATMLETMRKTVQREVHLTEKIKMQETELLESRIDIMLSQIQPHFLYNALGAIDKLYFENTEEGHNAIIKFSNYLRGNMDSLTKKNRIPFAEELAHTKQYLSLEELRFGQKLRVAYDIQTDDFTLPVLSLQPIVENAVRYGVTKKKGGGSVTIKTEETEHSYIIEIIDDGVGFNTDEPLHDGRTHIGIANVRQRRNNTLQLNRKNLSRILSRIIVWLTALCMVLTLLPMTAFAENEVQTSSAGISTFTPNFVEVISIESYVTCANGTITISGLPSDGSYFYLVIESNWPGWENTTQTQTLNASMWTEWTASVDVTEDLVDGTTYYVYIAKAEFIAGLGYACRSLGETVVTSGAITSVTAGTTTITSAGGTSVITIAGTNLSNGIKVTAFDGATATSLANATATSLTGTTTGSATSQTVTMTFPANTSTSTDKVYIIKASLDNGTTWNTNTATVTVSKASSSPDPIPYDPIPTPDPKPDPKPAPVPNPKESEVVKDVETDGIAPNTTLNTGIDKLKSIVFTAEELERIAAGEEARVYLSVKDISEEVSAKDKSRVEKALENYSLGLYLDINLFKQIGSDEAIKLFELGEKISISIEIPNDLQAQNRSYKIIRIHNGITEIIDGEYDSDTGLFVFETDLFSTYALIYIDEITPEVEVLEEKTNEIPKTGVTTNITGLFILSIISAVALVSRKKKDTHI